MPTNEQPSVQTGGGATTNVNTRGGDFTGRDRIAYTINFFGPIDVKGKVAQPPWQAFDWNKAEQAYRDSLIRHYGTLRVIGATTDSPLDNVFTDVFILNQLTAHRRASIEELQHADPDSFRQVSRAQERVSGLDLVQQGMQGAYPTHFYILGKPGAGKTTFLKYITMQAARNQVIDRIPIFVSLYEWTHNKNEDLFDFIVSRFAVCHVPEAAPFVKLLLEEGRALLLFDGLDEVRYEGRKRDRLTHRLQDFVRQYDRCQYLITCRIAASEYIFQGFQTVEVADFTPEQIASYAAKWFGRDTATYEFFMQELQKPEQKGVYELCNTPILLSLVCLAFANDRAFPPTHAELYEDALDMLLRRWDASRQIARDTLHPDEKIYRELSTWRKKELFARIAMRTFQKGEFFFRRRHLEGWITEYLGTLPNIKAIADIDGQIVLKAIEAQHSILVERAKDIYSFSHLTFQEYFTAHYLKQNQASGVVTRLTTEHVSDPRWREIFLLTASLLSEESANDFFHEMQQSIEQLVAQDPILLDLLAWADQKRIMASVPTEQCLPVRLAYIFLTLVLDLARNSDPDFAQIHNLELALDFARACKFDLALDFALALDLAHTLAKKSNSILARDLDLASDLALVQTTALQVSFSYSLFYAWSYAQLFAWETKSLPNQPRQEAISAYHYLIKVAVSLAKDAGATVVAQILNDKPIPSSTTMLQYWQHYADSLFVILQQGDLRHEWKISTEQIEELNHYFVANKLLVQCLNLSAITDRQAILQRIFKPPAMNKPEKQERKSWWKLW